MLLSSHKNIFGLGETYSLINDSTRPKYLINAEKRICSCGKPINFCPLWSSYLLFLERRPNTNFGERYTSLIDLGHEHFGRHSILCDSSKYLEPLDRIVRASQNGELLENGLTFKDIYVVHLIKDVRSYTTSMKYRYRLKTWQLYRYFIRWYMNNRKLGKYLEDQGLRFSRVSYEELCFNTKWVLEKLCTNLGIAVDEEMGDMMQSRAHIGVGNPMRIHRVKSKRIVYDFRWFFESDIQFIYSLLWKVREYNGSAVYGNLINDHDAQLFEPG
jgi:hypothetical protein